MLSLISSGLFVVWCGTEDALFFLFGSILFVICIIIFITRERSLMLELINIQSYFTSVHEYKRSAAKKYI